MFSLLTATLTVAAVLVCAVQAIRARRLLVSAMWLAGASAFSALLMFALGAAEVAVIELSVGAGLVTVLFVFAINIAGDEPVPAAALVPRPLAGAALLLAGALLAWFIVPGLREVVAGPDGSRFSAVLWESRTLDVLLQLVLIFAGVLGVLGLLADEPKGGEERRA